MIAQAIVIQDNRVLMVKQYVQRGDIVWNLPGGKIEENETPEQACKREVKEETGYDIQITKQLHEESGKFTFLAEIIGGELYLDNQNESNQDIIEVAWIRLDDHEKFDSYTLPLLCILLEV
ncbi:NUDIX hydrolase [Brevibacillus sp. FSL L8-0710]|uniref:NUDIX hydrolase n=1 Tax=Brevibacillus sp. FSL L8-0710 TaxID=2975313 RepID=UPI0030FC7FB9